jgi:hypothetical protein
METTQSYSESSNYREIWAILNQVAESQKETDRQMKQGEQEMREIREQIKEYNKRYGEQNNRFGEIVEYMVAPKLAEKFGEIGVVFEKASQNTKIRDKKNDISAEADIILENSKKVLLVEVKSKPTTEDVNDHIERLEKIQKYANLHGDSRAILGAVAGVVITENVKTYALKQGFYVVEPSGETFAITIPEGKYSVREW